MAPQGGEWARGGDEPRGDGMPRRRPGVEARLTIIYLRTGWMVRQEPSSSPPKPTPQPGSVYVTCNLHTSWLFGARQLKIHLGTAIVDPSDATKISIFCGTFNNRDAAHLASPDAA
eukprot:364742-Chlamydomonas_euryale.AAC.2